LNNVITAAENTEGHFGKTFIRILIGTNDPQPAEKNGHQEIETRHVNNIDFRSFIQEITIMPMAISYGIYYVKQSGFRTVSDGPLVFHITNKNNMFLKPSAHHRGITTRTNFLHPDHLDSYAIKGYITQVKVIFTNQYFPILNILFRA
jgi:hypothetical protein